MNIFFLDPDPRTAAEYTNDAHVRVSPKEIAQMLSTAWHKTSPISAEERPELYLPTHVNHPMTVWCRQTQGNYALAYTFMLELLAEFEFRFDKKHETAKLIEPLGAIPPSIANNRFTKQTKFPQCFGDYSYCQHADPYLGYRLYYVFGKTHLATWTRRPTPAWYSQMLALKNR